LTVSNTGQLTVAGTIEIFPGSQNVLNLNGGSITALGLSFSSPFNQFVWTAGTLDLTGEPLVIDSTASANFGDSAGTANSFVLGAGQSLQLNEAEYVGYGGTGFFNQSGGTNSITASVDLFLGYENGSTGAYTLSGAGALSDAGTEHIGLDGTGIFDQSSGTNAISGALAIATDAGSTGTYLLSGGLASVGLDVYVGGALQGPGGAGVLTVSGAGVLNVSGTLIVYNTSGTSVNLSGGTINAGALNITSGALLRGNQAGLLNVSGNTTISGTMSLDGETSFSAGSISIPSGGLLALNNASASAATITISSGGEVEMNNSAASILAGSVSNSGLILGAGLINGALTNNSAGVLDVNSPQTLMVTGAGNTNPGIINLGGGTLRFTQTLSNSGTVQGFGSLIVSGGLTITSTGTLALAGASNVSGPVTNNANGTIHLSGSSPNVFFGPVSNSGHLNVDAGASGTNLM